jgi:pyruvate, water dikinase
MGMIRTFADLHNDDVALAGGKGASLGELSQIGMPVPPGFVILASSYERFLAERGLQPQITSILDSVDGDDTDAIQEASKKLCHLILAAELPRYLTDEIALHFSNLNTEYAAVRSSATVEDSRTSSWAGILETYLNATREELLPFIVSCWASLFSPRAISYRLETGLRGRRISVAVVVQKMVNSEVSGTALSLHPVTNDADHAVIEAVYGLGEFLVSGSITPDTYVINKRTGELVDIHISEQEKGLFCGRERGTELMTIEQTKRGHQKLTSAEILHLTNLVVRIEQSYAVPMDIEWARQGDQLYILQARPITGLKGNVL